MTSYRKTYLNLAAVLASTLGFLVFAPASRLVHAQHLSEPIAASGAGSGGRSAVASPFAAGEKLIYVAEFSRLLLKKVDVADFRFSVSREPGFRKISDREPHQGQAEDLLKLTGVISSRGFFSKLFNLRFREVIESTVEQSSFRLHLTKKIDEQGKRARTSETTYDNGKIHWVERDPNNPANGVRDMSTSFEGPVQDLLSAIYFLRTQALQVGKNHLLTVSDSGRIFQVPVRIVEKKRMKTALGRIEAVRAEAGVFGPKGMIAGEGSFSIWFTNDSRHIPVSARIRSEYGTFDITLRKALQNPASKQSTSRATSAN